MDKTILLTGHTGFLGSYVYAQLNQLFNVVTLGRNISCDYIVDFFDWDGSLELRHKIDSIVHVAGLAHGKNYDYDSYQAVNVNAVGALKSIAHRNNVESFVFISSVSVYGLDSGFGISEYYDLKGSSPYAKSKIAAEKLIFSEDSFQMNTLVLRLPLIIGKNPPGNLGKLINSIKAGGHLFLRGNYSVKSVVRANDVAVFISSWLLSDKKESATLNLCNQVDPSFNWIENSIAKSLKAKYRLRIPIGLIRRVIIILHTSLGVTIPIISKILLPLTFDDSLARNKFNYQSKPLTAKLFSDDINPNH